MSFLGGFARSLQTSMIKDQDAERDMEKQRMLMELKKEYESEIVRADLTTFEGDKEILRNQFGDVIMERTLSPEQLELRKAELDKIKAESRRTTALADSAEFSVENQEEILGLDMEGKRADIEQSRAATASSHEAAATSRYNRTKAGNAEGRLVQDAIAELQGTLASIEDDGRVSDGAQAEAIAAKLDAAINTIDDPEELRREVIRLKTQAGRIATRARTLDSTRPSTSGSSGGLPELIRGLDKDKDENFSVVPPQRGR